MRWVAMACFSTVDPVCSPTGATASLSGRVYASDWVDGSGPNICRLCAQDRRRVQDVCGGECGRALHVVVYIIFSAITSMYPDVFYPARVCPAYAFGE